MKLCFHWFGASPMPFSFPLPYLQSVKLPQTHPHNRHTFSITRQRQYSPVDITKPTIWWNPKRWQSPALTLYLLTWIISWAPKNASKGQMVFNSAFKGLKEPLIHFELLHAPHLSSTLDILQQSTHSTAFP